MLKNRKIPNTRDEALRIGARMYKSGSPCPKGHNSYKFTKNYACVECHKERNKMRNKLPDRTAKRRIGIKRIFSELRLYVLEALSKSKCACCSESELVFLCIDHRNGGGTKHRKIVKPGQRLYYWLRDQIQQYGIRAVRKEFRVLCYNCNAAHWILGYCPHKGNTI